MNVCEAMLIPTPNIFIARESIKTAEELTLDEGQRLVSIEANERYQFNFANILGAILGRFHRRRLVAASCG